MAITIPAKELGARPRVSVIVPTRNGGAELVQLLRALDGQTMPRDDFEVVIGDDGSTDGSIGDLGEDGHVQVLAGPPRNSYVARNRAVAGSRADVLAFCDSDCVPQPGWLETGLGRLDETDVVAGHVEFMPPGRRSLWALVDMTTFLDQERAVQGGRAVTANLFVRRRLFDDLGGFDDSLPNQGDFDFVGRASAAGAEIAYAADVVVHHPARITAGAFLRKVWKVNLAYALREAGQGRIPKRLRLRTWIPILPVLRSRRHFGQPWYLERRRLPAGVRVSLAEDVAVLPLLYLVIPYVAGTAQVVGWFRARPHR